MDRAKHRIKNFTFEGFPVLDFLEFFGPKGVFCPKGVFWCKKFHRFPMLGCDLARGIILTIFTQL